MKNDEHDAARTCNKCSRPMTLIDSVLRLGGPPELLEFYCRACDDVNGKSETDNAPTMWQ